MSSGDITRYVVTVKFHEDGLSEINELNNHFTRAGFLLTLTDDDGNVHDLGTNTFGLISGLSEAEVKAQAAAVAESALDREAEISVSRWETWQTEQQQKEQ